jgi:hypothetical protein
MPFRTLYYKYNDKLYLICYCKLKKKRTTTTGPERKGYAVDVYKQNEKYISPV